MDFDLETALVAGTALTGLVWMLDAVWLGPIRRKAVFAQSHPSAKAKAIQVSPAAEKAYKDPWYVEYSKSFFPVLLIVLVLRSFVAEPFRIPSGSMMPTLLIGDFILVNKFAYGLRLPVVNTEIFNVGGPERGDVVVFRFPGNPSADYIKRIVGLPGDRIGYFDKQLYVNGTPVKQISLGTYEGFGTGSVMTGANLLKEELDGAAHEILVRPERVNIEGEYIVPERQYFVLGDNRDNSNDSRFWGFVPRENLVGKAFFIWMNWDWEAGEINFSRIGNTIE
jgi:signal peptidase I